MVKRTAPASFELFVTEYDYFIESTIVKLTHGAVRSADIEDLKQAVYRRVSETNYLARYNPEKGAFSTFIYWLIRSVVVNEYERSLRNPVARALGIQLNPSDHRRGSGRIAALREDFVDRRQEQRLVAADLFARLEQYVATQRDGVQLAEALRLLYEGHSPTEISKALGASRSLALRKRLKTLMTELTA